MKTATSWADRPQKSAEDTIDYELDWTAWLADASIAEHGADFYGLSNAAGATETTLAGAVQKAWVTGGVVGRRAHIDFWITLSTSPETRVYRRLYVVIV